MVIMATMLIAMMTLLMTVKIVDSVVVVVVVVVVAVVVVSKDLLAGFWLFATLALFECRMRNRHPSIAVKTVGPAAFNRLLGERTHTSLLHNQDKRAASVTQASQS